MIMSCFGIIGVYITSLFIKYTWQTSLGINLAENKPVAASNFLQGYPTLAPDRVTDGAVGQWAFRQDGCFVSGWSPLPWIRIDLQRSYNIDKIIVFLSKDTCRRGYIRDKKQSGSYACHQVVSGFEIYIGESKDKWNSSRALCHRNIGQAKLVEDVLCRKTMSGRYVTMHLPFQNPRTEIILCELFIFDQPRVTLRPQIGRPPPISGNLWCQYSLWLTFAAGKAWDRSYLSTWVKNDRVKRVFSAEVADRSVGEFKDGANLEMPKFAGFWFSPNTELIVGFKVSPTTTHKRDMDTILSNGGCNDRASLFVGYNRKSNEVIVTAKMKENFRVTLKMRAEVDKWIEVKAAMDSVGGMSMLTGSIDGQFVMGLPTFMNIGNGIAYSMNSLYVGAFPVQTANCQPFTGLIDYISVFHC